MQKVLCVLVLGVLLLSAPGVFAQSKDRPPNPTELVKLLGSPRFTERASAEKELLRMGQAAVPAIEAAMKSPDVETKTRCERLLKLIDDHEWRRKLDDYVADVKGERKYDLPLLKEYQKLLGNGQAARQLYAEFALTNRQLLVSAAGERKLGLVNYESRCSDLFRQLYSDMKVEKAAKADLACLLFISTHLKSVPTWDPNTRDIVDFFANPGLREAVTDEKTGEAFRKLLLAWAGCQEGELVKSQQFFLYFVQANNFKVALPLVRRWIRDKDCSPVNVRPLAVAVLGKVGGKDAADELRKLWADDTVLKDSFMGHEFRLCDQALAASIRIAGKNPKDFGVGELDLPLKAPTTTTVFPTGWVITFHGFPSDEARRAAFEKWKNEMKKKE